MGMFFLHLITLFSALLPSGIAALKHNTNTTITLIANGAIVFLTKF